jgi:glycosyltransferase involved in cell wall biosynthesis
MVQLSAVRASLPGAEPLHLGVFGWVQEGSGSVSSAHFHLCRELLSAGHQIEFYADPNFVPDPGYSGPQFCYVPVPVELRYELHPNRFPAGMRILAERLGGRRRTRRYLGHGMIVAESRHRTQPYDALLFLGTPPGRTIAGVPAVVWPQSAPQNELVAVRGLRAPVARVSGLPAYLKLRLFYEVKDRFAWSWAHHHYSIVASQAARDETVAFGVPPERVCVTPYAIDLERFAPTEIPSGPVKRILCIGRLDPRKRIDLLVDAVALLAARRTDFQVEVIGRDGYIRGWSRFVERSGRHLPITYVDAMSQSEIIRKLHGADLVVQPSEREEFGHAVAEALACGVPVVIGPSNRTREYAPPRGSVVFDRYTPDSLARAVERGLVISRDPSARADCRAAAGAFAPDRVAATVASFVSAAAVSPEPSSLHAPQPSPQRE